jgi:hypothetical protein
MTVAFGGTFALMRRGYHEADLRKMAARDI